MERKYRMLGPLLKTAWKDVRQTQYEIEIEIEIVYFYSHHMQLTGLDFRT